MVKAYPPKLKFQIVLELLQSNKTLGQVAKAYGVHPNSVLGWKETVLAKGPDLLSTDSTVAEYEKRSGS